MNGTLTYRLATKADLPEIINMLADDPFGAERENPAMELSDQYLNAFEKIREDPNQELTIVEQDGVIVATFQLSFIWYLNFEGALRAQIEAVRTHADYRDQGIGTRVFAYAINRAREKGCRLIQLTSDKRREDAIRFYEKIGFKASHEGMKLRLF